MKIKILAVALALTALPSLVLAEGCSYGKQKQAMSCAAGTAYDAATNSCLPVTT
ncbi:MAG: adenylosuccinate lyase [Sulfitobacter sp.]|nr:adenylosuccinate lyase [Sulfitobacter sp.]